jgi:tight adherence protein B
MYARWDSPVILVIGLVFAYVALLLLVTVVMKSRRTIALNRRQPEALEHRTALNAVAGSTKGFIDARLMTLPRGFLSQAVLDAAGLKKQASDYVVISGVVTLVLGVSGAAMGGLFMGILFVLLAFFALYATLRLLTSRRRAAFEEQVPDTLQLLTGGLRAGHSLLRAVDAAAVESQAPMAEELSRVVNESRIGRELGGSLTDVAQRTQSEDFAWIAQAIDIHREVGGDLAEVLDHVGETIRDRNQIRRQVRALSAEGRMSALVLLALPVVMFFALMLINPAYAHTFTSTLPGYLMIGVAAVMLGLGSFWLSRLIKPKY